MTTFADETLPVSDLEPPRDETTRRGLAVSIALLLVVAAVAAFVVRGGEPSPEERFAAIASAVEDEPFAFAITVGGVMPGLPQDISLSMVGAVDPATKRVRAEMDLSAIIPEGAGIPPKISFVSEDGVAYVSMPVPAGSPPQWTKIDASALAQAGGGLPSGTNPLDSFRQLQAVEGEIEDLGEEDVRGTSTTHYRAQLDVAKLLAEVPAAQREVAETMLGTMDTITADVWLDDDDRPRRQRMSFDVPAAATGGQSGGSLSITIEAFDFGKAVTIELPPAEQVVEGSGLFGQPPS